MLAPSLSDYKLYWERRADEQPVSICPAPLVSIVTVTLNGAATLERTIRSVQQQSFPSIEQIFIDGDSTDDTLHIIRRLARPQDYWISEKDKGISDAFNKGVALSRGRYVLFLNADDWMSLDQIENAVAALQRTGADFVFGDLLFYDRDQPIFSYVGDPDYARVIHRRMPAISHPTVLATRTCFERIGLFQLGYRNAMDYDWFLRLHRADIRGAYSDAVLGHMTHDGVSNRQFKRTIDEVRKIVIADGRNPFIAAVEARARFIKTVVSKPVKRHAQPVYQWVRGLTNAAYRPAPGRKSV